MASTSSQECTSVPNMENSPLSPEFLSLIKSAGKAKFDAELFKSKIDLLTRQYSQGFDEILRKGAHEKRDEVIRNITTEMDMEVSSYMVKLEDFKAKLKNESEEQDQNNDGPSKDGSLPGDSPVGIQEFREGMMQLQQQMRNMKDSNATFQKRFEDATAQNEERVCEVMTLKNQLGEALESNRKLKDDMMQLSVPPVVAANTACQKLFEDAAARNEKRVQDVTDLKKKLETIRMLKDKDDIGQTPVSPVVATTDESTQTDDEDFQTMCAEMEKDYEKFMKRYYEHYGNSMCSVREELLEEMRVLNSKLEACEQACSPADIRRGKVLAGLSYKRSRLTIASCSLNSPSFRAIDNLDVSVIASGPCTSTRSNPLTSFQFNPSKKRPI